MSTSESELKRWGRIAAELRSYRDTLRETWGGLDDIVLANYVAGTATPEEAVSVELAIRDRPAVRELVEVVRESLQPTWIPEAVDAAVAPKSKTVKVLRESLQMWLDDAGRVVSKGVEFLMRPLLTPAVDMALGNETEEARWQIPLDQSGLQLGIHAKPVGSTEKWQLSCTLLGDVDEQTVKRIWFSLSRPQGLPIVQAELAKFTGQFFEIDAGQWELRIRLDDEVRVLPIMIGEVPGG